MTQQERAAKIANAHWAYIRKTLSVHGVQDEELGILEHHYISAMIHGHGHGAEDERNGMFRTAPVAPPTVKNLCPSCLDEKQCGGVMMNAGGNCLHYRPSLRERMMDAQKDAPSPCDTCAKYPCDDLGGKAVRCSNWVKKQEAAKVAEDVLHWTCANYKPETCIDCDNCPRFSAKASQPAPKPAPVALEICPSCAEHPGCKGTVEPAEDGSCKGFSGKEGAFDLALPSIAIPCRGSEILDKLTEEIGEYEEAEKGSMAQLIEAWDCIQVAQTFDEHGGGVRPHIISKISRNLADWHREGRPVMQAKRAMEIKNAARAMYSEEDNAAILATV